MTYITSFPNFLSFVDDGRARDKTKKGGGGGGGRVRGGSDTILGISTLNESRLREFLKCCHVWPKDVNDFLKIILVIYLKMISFYLFY